MCNVQTVVMRYQRYKIDVLHSVALLLLPARLLAYAVVSYAQYNTLTTG